MRSLPEWFGIEESIVGYRRDVEELESLVVRVDDELAGFVTVKRHGDFAAEIVVMAVAKAHHRRGLGRHSCGASSRSSRGTAWSTCR